MPTPVGYVTEIASYRQLVKDFGTALSFDGSSGIVTLGTANPFTGSFYFSGWITWRGLNGGFQTIFSKRDSYAANGLMFSMSLTDTAGLLAFDTVTSYVSFNYRFPVGKPTHMIWVHDTVNSKDYLYINGILTSTQNIATLGTKTDAVISIGGTQSPIVDTFNGDIDEVCIGTSAPTYEEVIKMYAKYIYPSQWSYLKFDEGTGSTATDSSGNGNNGTITTAVYIPSKVMRVRQSSTIDLGNCINFNTATSRITFTIPSSWDLSSYSMGFWIYPTSLNTATTRLIDYAPAGNGFLAQVRSDQGIVASVKYSVTDAQMATGAGTIQIGKWQRVVITWSTADNTPHIYINGVLTDTTPQNKSGTLNTPFPTGSTGYLGNRTGNDRAFAGLMDEFCFWPGALTQDQIKQDYVNPQSVTANLITRYKMDEESGSVLDDFGLVTGTATTTTQGVTSIRSDRFLIPTGTQKSMSFSSPSYAIVPLVPSTSGFSLSFWMFKKTISGSATGYVYYSNAGNGGFSLTHLSSGTNRIRFQIYNGSTIDAAIDSNSFPVGKWTFVTATFAPNNAKLYIDSSSVGTTDASCQMTDPDVAQNMTLAGYSYNHSIQMSNIAIKNFTFQNTATPWTQQQIKDLYYRNIIPSGAVQWSMNNVATDQNGANALTLSNTSYSTDVPIAVRSTV